MLHLTAPSVCVWAMCLEGYQIACMCMKAGPLMTCKAGTSFHSVILRFSEFIENSALPRYNSIEPDKPLKHEWGSIWSSSSLPVLFWISVYTFIYHRRSCIVIEFSEFSENILRKLKCFWFSLNMVRSPLGISYHIIIHAKVTRRTFGAKTNCLHVNRFHDTMSEEEWGGVPYAIRPDPWLKALSSRKATYAESNNCSLVSLCLSVWFIKNISAIWARNFQCTNTAL